MELGDAFPSPSNTAFSFVHKEAAWGLTCLFYSVVLYLTPLRQDLSMNVELGWQPASASILPSSPLHNYRLACSHAQLFT